MRAVIRYAIALIYFANGVRADNNSFFFAYIITSSNAKKHNESKQQIY
jgi:hypothetical protein